MMNRRLPLRALSGTALTCAGLALLIILSLLVTPSVPRAHATTTSLASVPRSLHRRAAQLLEELRHSELAPGWAAARLSTTVMPLFRPDVTGVAYYEFRVVTGPRSLPAGFITVSTGPHDLPIVHWSSSGEAPSQTLQSEAAQLQSEPVKYYKLDTLSYAAEDSQGSLITSLGSPLLRPNEALQSGASLASTDGASGSALWEPDHTTGDDLDGSTLDGTLTITGPQPGEEPQLSRWDSWQSLRDGYSAAYAPLLSALRAEAAESWQIEQAAEEEGTILLAGEAFDLPLLAQEVPTVTLSGEGVSYATGHVVEREDLPPVYVLNVRSEVPEGFFPLAVEVTYGQGAVERELFLITGSAESKGQYTVALPLIASGTGDTPPADPEPEIGPAAELQGKWGPWTYFWAGTAADQRMYYQIPKKAAPNNSSCASGCGATAWAMLFGWADYQAARGNSYWKGRRGLYRQGGGRSADAVAPATMDEGVRAMTWELRNKLGTICDPFSDNGATPPWNMANASAYLRGRSGTRLRTHYNILGLPENRLRSYARSSIHDRKTPAIIGTGLLSHYPLAWAYSGRTRRVRKCLVADIGIGINCWRTTEYDRYFLVNQGYGGAKDGWIPANTWFAGEILP